MCVPCLWLYNINWWLFSDDMQKGEIKKYYLDKSCPWKYNADWKKKCVKVVNAERNLPIGEILSGLPVLWD